MRNVWRALVVSTAVPLSLLLASPAFAEHRSDGDDPGQTLTFGTTLLIFVGIPALVIATVWLLVSAPTLARGPRYRPGRPWTAYPRWFNGPSWFGGPHEAESLAAVVPGEATLEGGGSSARW